MTGIGQEPWPEANPLQDLAGFRATSRGPRARFAASQAAIVRSLVSQVAELVGGEPAADGMTADGTAAADGAAGEPAATGADRAAAGRAEPGPASPDDEWLAAQLGVSDNSELPDDPILARLLPDAYADDPDAAGEFRRYTEVGLRSGKVAAARTVLDTLPERGGRVALSQDDAQAWLRALNDVRLSLGVVLGVTDDFDDQVAGLPEDDPQAAYIGVYQWLAFLQESLIEALT